MTLFTTFACILAGAHGVAFPAFLVNHHFCAECFICDIGWIGAMAGRAGVSHLLGLRRFIVTNLALDRRRFEIIGMGGIQLLGIYLMMTLDTLDPQIL